MTLVKICGISKDSEILFGKNCGADFLGLLVDIPRTNLSNSQLDAKNFIFNNPSVKFIILTIETDILKLVNMIKYIMPWGIQLLKPSPEIIRKLSSKTNIKIIPVIHIIDNNSIDSAKEYYSADYLLLDSKDGRNLGGTGKTHNWDISKKIIEDSPIPVFLAGGLNQENIKIAIQELNPYAVDIESSLRNKEGFRDLKKLKKLMNILIE